VSSNAGSERYGARSRTASIWYLYEDPTFYWLTDTQNFLHRAVLSGERLVVVVDVCDIDTGKSSTSGPEASARSFPSIELVR
jgi:hypothetical protein